MNLKKKKKTNKINKKNLNILTIILNIILVILIIINTYLVLKYDILPIKYLILYLFIAIVIPIIIFIFLIYKKTKNKIKITLLVLDFIYIILFTLVGVYLSKTFNFLDDFNININYITRNYKVLVSKDSAYQDIKDLNKKNIGYIEFDNANYNVALGEINKLITFQNKDYLDYTTMSEAFKVKEIDALLSTDIYYEMLSEQIETFKDDYRVIYEFSVQEKEEDVKKDVDVTKDVFNIYITGMDTYGNITNISRSDVNIVLSVNPKTNQILMVNIPRDYYVVFHGQTKKDKLTHAGLYGTNMSIKTIEDILDIDINYYVKTNFDTVIKLVDALGGVDVYSMYTFNSTYYFKKGYNHVNGKQALTFARTRYVLPNGDVDRGRNQEAMIQAIITKATSPAILTRYTTILDTMKNSFLTNISTDKITDLIKLQLDKMPKWNITAMTLTGFGDEDYTSAFKDIKVFVMHPNEETVKAAKKALQDVQDGKILESSYEDNNGEVYTPFIPQPSPKPTNPSEPVVPEEEEPTTDKDDDEDKDNTSDNNLETDDTNDNQENKDDNSTEDTKPNENENQNPDSDIKDDNQTDNTESNENNDNNNSNDNSSGDIIDIPGIVN